VRSRVRVCVRVFICSFVDDDMLTPTGYPLHSHSSRHNGVNPEGTPPTHSSRHNPQRTQHTAGTAATPRYPQGIRQTPGDAPIQLTASSSDSASHTHSARRPSAAALLTSRGGEGPNPPPRTLPHSDRHSLLRDCDGLLLSLSPSPRRMAGELVALA